MYYRVRFFKCEVAALEGKARFLRFILLPNTLGRLWCIISNCGSPVARGVRDSSATLRPFKRLPILARTRIVKVNTALVWGLIVSSIVPVAQLYNL